MLYIEHAHVDTHGLVLSHMLCCLFQLRTQALASLHCGLQNNQGLPVAHVARWLGMEVPFFLAWCLLSYIHFTH